MNEEFEKIWDKEFERGRLAGLASLKRERFNRLLIIALACFGSLSFGLACVLLLAWAYRKVVGL